MADTAGSLAGLVATLDREARGIATRPETHEFFRRTWSRLSADQRLAQSLASLPENPGPLNSQQLVHRALGRMRTLSPAYFERFGAHVDALLAIERASGMASDPETGTVAPVTVAGTGSARERARTSADTAAPARATAQKKQRGRR